MTAGLPGTHSGGSIHHRRILAALLITTIAAAPAHAQYAAPPAIESGTAYDIEDAALTSGSDSADEVPDAVADARPAEIPTPAEHAEALPAEYAEALPAEHVEAPPAEHAPPSSVGQVIYKGVVGNILEAMPLDPEQRVQLQRGNAIINNAFTGRSLAILLGIASPPLMIAGLIWGIWSAINIKAAQTDTRTALAPSQPAVQPQEPASAAEPVTASRGEDAASADRDHVAAQSLD